MSQEERLAIQDAVVKPKRVWRRRLLWVLVIIPFGLIAGILVLGQTSAMKLIVEPLIEEQLGVDVHTKSVQLMPTGEIVIHDAVCETDEIPNRAGSLIECQKATIEVDWWAIVRGGEPIESIVIEKPVLRFSQDSNTGVLNFVKINPKSGGGGKSAIPAIEIKQGILEIGEHDQQNYRLLKELAVSGSVSAQNASGVSGFELIARSVESQIRPNDDIQLIDQTPGVLRLSGQFADQGIEGVINGIQFQDWPADIVPSRSRGMFEELALAGNLKPTRFSISNDGLVRIVLMLDGVELNLPIDDTLTRSNTDDEKVRVAETPLRMKNTSGVIEFGTKGLDANITGLIDELSYNVELSYFGLTTTSSFEAKFATDFRLDGQFKPIRFLPQSVVSKLERFEYPTADIQATIEVIRSEMEQDSGVSEIQVSGRASISNGTATYRKFKYPFEDIEGVIEFDPDQLLIKDIKGVGPSGATLLANGKFSPLGEHSNVVLDLSFHKVGLDEHLLAAMDRDQQELVNALFNPEQYQRLIDEKLVLSPEQHQDLTVYLAELQNQYSQRDHQVDGADEDQVALANEIASVERVLQTPLFDFGGSADVDVQLVRHPERPSDDRWTTDVEVRLDQSGIVSEHFPIPVIAEDVVIQIDDEKVELVGGTYRGLTGGHAEVSVLIDTTVRKPNPVVEVYVSEFPIDQRMVAAIPGYDDPQSDDPDDMSMRRIIDRLQLEGTVDCEAIIGPRSNGRLGFDVEATILDGVARPTKVIGGSADRSDQFGVHPVIFDDILGTVYITEERIVVDLAANLTAPSMPLAPTPVEILTQLTLPRSLSGGDDEDFFGPPLLGPELYAWGVADGIDLAMPLEHAIATVSPRLARQASELFAKHSPEGVLGLDVRLEGVIGGTVESDFAVHRIEDVQFDYEDNRYSLRNGWGRSGLHLSSSPSVHFEDFRVSLNTARSESESVLSLHGELPIGRAGGVFELSDDATLQVRYENGQFDSPVTQLVVGFVSSAGAQWCSDHHFGGQFDLGVMLTTPSGGHFLDGEYGELKMLPVEIDGRLEPESLALNIKDQSVKFNEVIGTLEFNGLEGAISGIKAKSDHAELAVDGRWLLSHQNGIDLELEASAHGDLLTGATRSLFPKAVDQALERLQVQSRTDPVSLDSLQLQAVGLGSDLAQLHVDGRVGVTNTSAVLGLPISDMTGNIRFVADTVGEDVGYEIEIDADRLRAGSMRVHDARALIIGDASQQGVVLVPEISAQMHGGQIAGSAQVYPEIEDNSRYWIELHASGVRAAPVFDDILLPPEGLVGPPVPGQETVQSAWSKGEDLSRGALIGDLTMTGLVGDPSSLVGRGLMRVSGGPIFALPGLIHLIEASNFSLPTGESLDYAQASFYIDGPTLALEQLSAASKRVEIHGYGTLDWTTREMDLRFRSRSATPIPIVSELLEELRDELITIQVSGSMMRPEYSAQPFGTTRRLFDTMLGKPMTDHEIKMREVEQQIRSSRPDTLDTGNERKHTPTRGGGHDQWGSGHLGEI